MEKDKAQVSDVSTRLANLSAKKQELLMLRLKRQGIGDTTNKVTPQSRGSNALPLSFSQERLWFLDQLQPGTSAYNIRATVCLKGQLIVAALEHAFSEIVRRHEVLRTTFSIFDGRPVQIISPASPVRLAVVDLGEIPEPEQEIEARRLSVEEAHRPFDLAKGSLLRAGLLRLNEQKHFLVLTMHHIISDGWSVGILVREAAVLYEAFINNQSSPLTDLPIQYVDYAIWQRSRLKGQVLQDELGYWKRQLDENLPVLELPTDSPRPAIQTSHGARRSLALSGTLSESLKALSRKKGVTLFMTLLAAFKTLLYRYTRQADIIVGTPIANRNRVEVEGLIGFFVNVLVMRTDLSGDPSFEELLERVRVVALGAYAHQDLPFEKLLEELQPKRELSRTPLFQVWFNLFNVGNSKVNVELPALTMEDLSSDGTPSNAKVESKFDLALLAGEHNEGIQLNLDYNTDLFNATTITRMLGHFEVLLEAIAANPQQVLSTFPLLTDLERRQLCTRRNLVSPANAFVEFRRDEIEQSIASRFESRVKKYPKNIAVKATNYEWTYEVLNREANGIAQAISTRCGSGEERVALLFDHSPPMIAGVLGALKSGKTYVPLDPSYPTERLSYILEDSQPSAIITDNSNLAFANELTRDRIRVINIGDIDSNEPVSDVGTQVSPNSLAYILYTSGSTGQPKGAMQNHRNVLHFIRIYTNNLQISADDRLSLLSSYSFDAAIMDIFGALLNGASLYPIDIRNGDAASLSDQLIRGRITIYHSTPTVYRYFIGNLSGDEEFPNVRLVVLGGEEVLKRDVELYKKHFSQECIMVNGLGPTESTVSLQYFVDKQTKITRNSVTVGYPVEDTQVILLNEFRRATPIYGEIAIKSAHVALGYWRRPQLTEEVFLPDPDGGNRRVYCTGDMGRLTAEGSIEFAGRVDRQVKVRGNRIELGEIETALNQHPDVRESAVIAKELPNADKEILAFVVPAHQQTLTTAQLRSFLKLKLPNYMLPSKVALVDHLPLTPTGKLDRRALSDIELRSAEAESFYVGPRSPVEVGVAQIWAQVLGVKGVGIRDNFFELGGHSLLAAQIISRLKEAFGVELPVRAMFDSATVGGLAQQVEAAMKAGRELQMPPIQRVRRDGKLAVSFAQQRLWFFDQLEPDSSVYNIGAAVRLEGVLDLPALLASLKQIIARHETLRTSFAILDDEPLQVIVDEVEFELPEVDLTGLGEAEQKAESMRVAIEERRRPFDLSKSPLMRAKVIKLGAEENIALLTMHHIISDGWSMGVLIAELTALYQANREGKQAAVPELEIQYADYAQWQREWLTGEVLEEQLGYWKKKLEGSAPVMELPADRPRPAIQTYRGARQEVRLGKELSEGLKQMSRREQVTMFMLLLAAFKVLLYRYSGQTDIVVGTPIANRSRGEIEGLIGYFANTLVLRTELEEEESFQQALRRVRETCLGAYAYEDLPFDKLVEEMQPARDLSYNPLFQVMFELENAQVLTGAMKDSGLSLNTIEVKTTTAMFDLTLDLVETPEGMIGSLEYNTDLFDAGTIKRMIGHFQNLLEAVASNPDQSISALAMLTEAERHQLLVEWNDTTKDYALDQTLDGMFEAQVERTPEATALVCEEEHLSYRELNKRANQVARHLQRMGAGPEVLVGICMERSVEMVVGLLGILKSGAAYVPMDPGYPADRLAYMIEDAKAPVLLSQQHLVERLTKSRARVVCLDRDWQAIGEESDEKVSGGAKGDNLAYVIYTSGSTGWPKGAMNTHRGICNRLEWMQEAYGLSEVDRVLQKTPFSFDVSVWEFFWPLITGARLVMARPGGHQDSAYLLNVIEEQEITTLHFVPSMLEVFLQEEELDRCGSVRQVICSGEALSHELQERYFGRIEGALHNLYGPTEAAIDVTYWECERGSKKRSVPIGKPIANTQIYILNGQMEPVPVGVAGELHIGGVGLARGYFNKAEMTGARFIPDPFSKDAGARLYKTGDLARYLEDGEIEYLGRIDHQVKLRGFRIELGEIEAVLGKHEGVRECVVMAREDVPGDTRLVAYVVAESDHQTSGKELRAYLKQQLPDYMLPSAYMMLERMPLTPNGKVDRRALPPPDDTWLGLRASFIAPRDELESQLAQIWEGILDIHPIGITANFFDLGGHSFLAARLMREIYKRFGRKLPLYALFQAATIEHLAGLLRAQTAALTDSPLVPIQTNGSKLPLFCVHEVTGSVRSYFSLARHLSSDQPVYGLRAPDADDDDNDSHITLEGMAAQYIKEMRAVQQEGPYHLAGWSYGGLVAFEMAQQLQEQGQEVALLVLFDTTKPTPSIMDSDIEDQAGFLATLAGMLNLPVTADELRPLDPVERLNFILERAKRIDSHSRGMDIALLRNTFRIIRTNLRASANYMPKFYPHQITLFRSSEMVTGNLSKEAVELYNDPALGWNEFSSEPVDIHVIPGNHFTLFAESGIQFVAESLTACLNGTRAVGSHS